ncbi:thioesterase family protein [soil metagenome]
MSRTRRDDYPHFRSFTPRWRDNDVYGHVNNAVFYEFVDSVVNGWLIEAGGMRVPDGPVICLVVESGCTYHASLAYPEPVQTGLRTLRVGETSITYGIGLFAHGAAEAAADARFTHVCVDGASRRPVPIPAALRAALRALDPGRRAGEASREHVRR